MKVIHIISITTSRDNPEVPILPIGQEYTYELSTIRIVHRLHFTTARRKLVCNFIDY